MDNEQRAYDLALAYIQADINSLSGVERTEEKLSILHNAGSNTKEANLIDSYNHLYDSILKSLNDGH